MTRKNSINFAVLVANMLAALLVLSACTTGADFRYRQGHPDNPDYRAWSSPHRCVSPDCGRVDNLAKKIFANYPVDVVRVGQSKLIAFSTDYVFRGHSSNFSRCAYSLLNAVVTYLKNDDMAVLEVGAYTDNHRSAYRDRIISSQRAAKIVHYLTTKGIPANLAYAVGNGQKPVVARNHSFRGARLNRRIEIRYKLLKE